MKVRARWDRSFPSSYFKPSSFEHPPKKSSLAGMKRSDTASTSKAAMIDIANKMRKSRSCAVDDTKWFVSIWT